MIGVRTLVRTLKPQPLVCECCEREVEKVRGSIWGHRSCCTECFLQWYDPDNSGIDNTDRRSIGNYVRKKNGLPPLHN